MGRLIAGINMTLDGFCDHTAVTPDESIHGHYADLLKNADAILFGRITYELMTYWKTVAENPTGTAATDDFARTIDRLPKIVFSHTLKHTGWDTARLAERPLAEEVRALQEAAGRSDKDILAGSRSLIVQLMEQRLLDELQLCIHPVIAGKGLPLFENLQNRTEFKLVKTKTFDGGAVILYYQPLNNAL